MCQGKQTNPLLSIPPGWQGGPRASRGHAHTNFRLQATLHFQSLQTRLRLPWHAGRAQAAARTSCHPQMPAILSLGCSQSPGHPISSNPPTQRPEQPHRPVSRSSEPSKQAIEARRASGAPASAVGARQSAHVRASDRARKHMHLRLGYGRGTHLKVRFSATREIPSQLPRPVFPRITCH